MKQFFQKRTNRPSLSANEGNGGRIDFVQQKSRKAWKQMRFLQFVCVLAMACFPLMSMAWSDRYSSRLTANVTPTGAGKVYVSTTTSYYPDFKDETDFDQTEGTSSSSHTYHLYAQPKDDYEFAYWKYDNNIYTTQERNNHHKATVTGVTGDGIEYTYEAVFKRRLTVSTQELEMDAWPNNPATATFTVQGFKVYNNGVTLTVSNNSPFTINKTSLTKAQAEAETGATITVTFTPTAYQDYTGSITISTKDGNKESKVIVNLIGHARRPTLTVNPNQLVMEARPNSTPYVTATFTVQGQHLIPNKTVNLSVNNSAFTVSPTYLTKAQAEAETGATITVTYKPTAYQNYTGKITISSQDAVSKEVNLTGYSDAYPVTIGSAKATTLYVDFPLKNPKDFYKNDNLVVSYAKEVTDKGNDKKELKLEAMGDYIPANTGVVVQGNPNSDGYYFMKYHGSAALTPVDVNLLKGTTTTISRESVLENAPEGSLVMTLSVLNNTLGFYKYIGDNLSANKAYILYTPTDGGNVSFLSLGVDGDEELDVIHDVKVKVTDDAWYTLQGARLNGKPTQRGIYIHGGKKVAVK